MGFYFQHAFRLLGFDDIAMGLSKPIVFAYLIVVISCHNGLAARGGADGVGRATTRTVYAAAIAILVCDFLVTKLFVGL